MNIQIFKNASVVFYRFAVILLSEVQTNQYFVSGADFEGHLNNPYLQSHLLN